MPNNRLFRELKSRDPEEIDEIFGNEHIEPDPSIPLAPVKRVAIYAEAFFPKVDGVSKTAHLTLRYLQKTGREVLVFAPDISPPQVGPTRVIAQRSFGFPFVPETRVALPSQEMRRYLDEFQPDIIHMFSPVLMATSGIWAAHRRGIPVIGNYQTDLPGYAKNYRVAFMSPIVRRWLRYIHNRCHLTLAPSDFTLQQLHKDGYRRLRIWGRGVNSVRFTPTRRSAKWRERLLHGRPADSLLCLYVGRLAPEKRLDLLDTVARLPGVALTVVGDGAARKELEQRFAGTDAYFTGYLYGDDLADAYASADVFLFPGQNETFGQVVQEAMASGLPAVIINEGGITDLVTDDINGYQCPATTDAFAIAVTKLRDNPTLRRQMGEESRRIAEQRPWEKIMAQLEQYYRQATAINDRFLRLKGRSRL